MKMATRQVKATLASVGASFFLLSAPVFSSGQASQDKPAETMSVPLVQCVIGLQGQGIKPGVKGTVSVEGGAIHFVQTDKESNKAQISISSIQDIYLGQESRQSIGAVKMVIPYGGGRLLSLFSHKVEVMTVEYTDENGAFHAALFVFPPGHATAMKGILVAQGAKTTEHAPAPEEPKDQKEQKP